MKKESVCACHRQRKVNYESGVKGLSIRGLEPFFWVQILFQLSPSLVQKVQTRVTSLYFSDSPTRQGCPKD